MIEMHVHDFKHFEKVALGRYCIIQDLHISAKLKPKLT